MSAMGQKPTLRRFRLRSAKSNADVSRLGPEVWWRRNQFRANRELLFQWRLS